MSHHKTIPLGPNVDILVDPDQYPHLSTMKWHRNSEGYAVCFDHPAITYMHRLVTDAGPGQIVDHINGNKLDNRRANLRVTSSQSEFTPNVFGDNQILTFCDTS